jgi:hypothetical protein
MSVCSPCLTESATGMVISDAFPTEGRAVYSFVFFADTVGAASKATTKNMTHLFSGIFIYYHQDSMMEICLISFM